MKKIIKPWEVNGTGILLIMLLVIPLCLLGLGCGSSSKVSGFDTGHEMTIEGPVEEAWVAWYDPPGTDRARAIDLAVDDLGNVYVLKTNYEDLFTLKYDSNGNLLWHSRYEAAFTAPDGAVAIDNSGNVVATFNSWTEGEGSTHYTTVKYSSAGEQIWVVYYDGPGIDVPSGLEVDQQDNIYVTGQSDSHESSFDYDYVTIKYDANGKEKWRSRYVTPGENTGADISIDLSNKGQVYVTGQCGTVKYDAQGNELWGIEDECEHIVPSQVVDMDGNVYIEKDDRIAKYETDGSLLWSSEWETANEYTYIRALALEEDSNIYVYGNIPLKTRTVSINRIV